MNSVTKNKLLTGLVVLLLIANAATITMFWLGRAKHPQQMKGTPQQFLIESLKLDSKQQEQLQVLVKGHRSAAEKLRMQTKEAKEALFDLLKQPASTDSAKQAAAKAVSVTTEALDLLTLNHFQKVRVLCNPDQQKKFDEIINDVVRMIGQPRPPMDPGRNRQGLPPGRPDSDRPPPPEQ